MFLLINVLYMTDHKGTLRDRIIQLCIYTLQVVSNAQDLEIISLMLKIDRVYRYNWCFYHMWIISTCMVLVYYTKEMYEKKSNK